MGGGGAGRVRARAFGRAFSRAIGRRSARAHARRRPAPSATLVALAGLVALGADPAAATEGGASHVMLGMPLLAGLTFFATLLSILHLRERARWTRRERALTGDLEALRGAFDRAELLVQAERQVVVTWDGRGDPSVEGDATIAGGAPAGGLGAVRAPGGARRVVAFGSWLAAVDAVGLEAGIERLRARGEGFALTARTLAGGLVEAEGRAVGGRALLRLRDVTGERRARAQLERELAQARAEHAALTALIDAVPHPVWRRDGEGGLAFANAAYLAAVEAADVAAARAGGLDLLERPAREEASRRRAGGARYAARVGAIVAGARRILEVVEVPTPSGDPDDPAAGAVGAAVDVSEVEGVRADIQRQMDAHVRLLDRLPIAVALFDARQRLVFHNTAYRLLFGLDPAFLDEHPLDGEILDRLRGARSLPEQADYRAWKADVLAAYRATEARETWWYLPDRRTLRVVAEPNPQGGVTYLFDDVSERMGLESRYNTLMRVQSETLDTLKEAVAVFGSDGRLKLANRAFATTWHLEPASLAGEPHVDRIIELCRPLGPADEGWAAIRGAVAGLPEARLGIACELRLGDGRVLDGAAQPLPDGATLVTLIDITASVSVKRVLTERNEALLRAARIRDEFVHHVSYELRSPLTNTIGFTQLLVAETAGALNPRQREYADHILRSSGALMAIINDILDLASIDTGTIEIERDVVDVRETIAAAARGLEDRIAEAAIRLEVDVPDDIGAFLADAKRVRQILYNLLSNAVGFSAPGQAVRVTARRGEGVLRFEVSDEGCGMTPELRERVFDRFESRTLGTRHRGVGLGLSIVRSFVELHGGTVALDSAPGQGTRVVCTFPVSAPPQLAAAE